MTAAEMKYEIDIRLKGLPEEFKKLFITLDYSKYLSESQVDFFLAAYKTFDRTELEKKIMPNLVMNFKQTSFALASVDNLPNGTFVQLPDGFEFTLDEFATLTDTTGIALVYPIQYNYYVSNVDNPFKSPYEELVWRLDYGGGNPNNIKVHELITDGIHNLISYTVRYLRKPVDINVDTGTDCEINPLYHNVIVNSAVKKMLEVVYQLYNAEKEKNKQRQQQQPQEQE